MTDDAIAEQSIRELSQEIEGLTRQRETLLDDRSDLRDKLAAEQKRLAEATRLLRRCTFGQFRDSHLPDDLCRFLSATPSPPAERAPSLVDAVDEAISRLSDEDTDPDVCCDRALAILRAAREAGGR